MRRTEHRFRRDLFTRALLAALGGSALMLLLALLSSTEAIAERHANGAESGLRLYSIDGIRLGDAPRLETDVSIKVHGMLARVSVRQSFRNVGDSWVEGIYVFPLPEDAAVDRLRMRYNGRLIEGEIQAREQARRTYQKARAQGQGASLLDQQRDNVFTSSVANIPPGAAVRIEIEYQHAVQWRDSKFSLRFPTVVGPRYIPGTPLAGDAALSAGTAWALATDQVADAAKITPPVIDDPDAGFQPVGIEVELDTGLELSRIDSPYHAIDYRQHGEGRYRVSLSEPMLADRDFVLRWQAKPSAQPVAALFAEKWRDRHYRLLMLMPPTAGHTPALPARELVLVIDTSGSMHGDSIRQARRAVLYALDQLQPHDRFNVVQFDDKLHSLFDGARPADHEHLKQARRYVRALQADGGTEMLPAMRFALRDPHPSGLLRQVVFLTDGAVGNEQALFETVVARLGDSRLFTIGIGSAPNALFMNKAAGFGRGTFTYIGSVDEVQDKVTALFGQLSRPLLTDLQLHWSTNDEVTPGDPAEPLALQQTPQRLPDLYAGDPLLVAIQAELAPDRVEISGRFGDRPWRYTVALHGVADSAGVHALWARQRIDDWRARQVLGEAAETVLKKVLELALNHRLVSRYTSLVAVDKTPMRPQTSTLHSAAVPTRVPAGWSANKVFGSLPATATSAPMALLLGLLCPLLAGLLWRRQA